MCIFITLFHTKKSKFHHRSSQKLISVWYYTPNCSVTYSFSYISDLWPIKSQLEDTGSSYVQSEPSWFRAQTALNKYIYTDYENLLHSWKCELWFPCEIHVGAPWRHNRWGRYVSLPGVRLVSKPQTLLPPAGGSQCHTENWAQRGGDRWHQSVSHSHCQSWKKYSDRL